VRSDGRLFSLTPRVLSLGWAYLSSLNLWDVTQPLMEELADRTKESCSVATLDLPDVVYVARVPTRRIMTISLGVGTRLPAHCTGMGRVLLAALADSELDDFLADVELEAFTERTITDAGGLRQAIERVREEGWALVDQELEMGLRSIAAPLRAEGRAIAALNVAVAAARVPLDDLLGTMLPELLRTAQLISTALDASRRNGGTRATAAG
jgi:IclR family transcriptional regulator, pca regulon regulatory protein